MHIGTAEYAWCWDPKSPSTTHHEFCMKTCNGCSGIHSDGKNGSTGIKGKASHKPCTLCFKMSESTYGCQEKCHFSSEEGPFFPVIGWRCNCTMYIFSWQLAGAPHWGKKTLLTICLYKYEVIPAYLDFCEHTLPNMLQLVHLCSWSAESLCCSLLCLFVSC